MKARRLRGVLLALLATLAVGLLLPLSALAAPVPGWSAEPLTEDGIDQDRPFVWEDFVVWGQEDAGDEDIFLSNILAPAPLNISNQDGDDISPSIDNGWVAWQWDDGHDWEIMLWDITGRHKYQITDNDYDDYQPHIDGRMVVFTALVPGASEEIYLYNISTGIDPVRLTFNFVEDAAAVVQDGYPWSSGLVAWQQWDGHDYEINYYKIGLSSGRLTDNDYADATPRVGAGWIVWEGWPDVYSDIFAANVYTNEPLEIERLTDDSLDDWSPQVEAGKVVWLKGIDPIINTDLYTYDLRFDTSEKRLTNDDIWDDVPSLNLWRATWYQMWGTDPGTDMQIMLKRLLGGAAGTLSDGYLDSQASSLSGHSATWVWDDGNDYEVVAAQAQFPFEDVWLTHPYKEAIESLALMGVVAGKTADTFDPDGYLLRQQYAKMAVLGVGAPVNESDVCPFIDVPVSGPGELYPDNYIAVANARGLVLGKDATRFAPYEYLTRAQAVTIAVRAAQEYASGSLRTPLPWWEGDTSWYTDPPHGNNIHIAEFNSLLEGIENLETWNPDDYCPREEAAQIIWNMWQRLAAPGANVIPL